MKRELARSIAADRDQEVASLRTRLTLEESGRRAPNDPRKPAEEPSEDGGGPSEGRGTAPGFVDRQSQDLRDFMIWQD